MTQQGLADAIAKVSTFLSQRYPSIRMPFITEGEETRYFVSDWDGYYRIVIPKWWDEHRLDLLVHECGHLIQNVAGRTRDTIAEFGAVFGDISTQTQRNEIVVEHFTRAEDPTYRGQNYPHLVGVVPFDAEKVKALFAEWATPEVVTAAPTNTNTPTRSEEAATTYPSPLTYPVTRAFGDLSFPQYGPHTGVDLAIPYGDPIIAVTSGTVILDDDNSSFDPADSSTWSGISVMVERNESTVVWYAHLSKNIVTHGQFVRAGQIIGYCGSTGASTGPHLHLEIRSDGRPIDPFVYFQEEDDMDDARVREIIQEEVRATIDAIKERLEKDAHHTHKTGEPEAA